MSSIILGAGSVYGNAKKEELERQDWNLMESKVVKKLIGFL